MRGTASSLMLQMRTLKPRHVSHLVLTEQSSWDWGCPCSPTPHRRGFNRLLYLMTVKICMSKIHKETKRRHYKWRTDLPKYVSQKFNNYNRQSAILRITPNLKRNLGKAYTSSTHRRGNAGDTTYV